MVQTKRITLELPAELLETTEALVKAGKASSLDELITKALQQQVSQLETEKPSSNSSSYLSDDPIFGLGENPVSSGVTDVSENLDQYLYDSL